MSLYGHGSHCLLRSVFIIAGENIQLPFGHSLKKKPRKKRLSEIGHSLSNNTQCLSNLLKKRVICSRNEVRAAFQLSVFTRTCTHAKVLTLLRSLYLTVKIIKAC